MELFSHLKGGCGANLLEGRKGAKLQELNLPGDLRLRVN
jgi:hypothetical protein